MRTLFTICIVFLTFVAAPAFADIPPPTNNATNNSTNAATNNGTSDSTNNATSDSTNNDTTSENNSTSGDSNGTDSDTTDDADTSDDKGCSVAGNPMGTFAPILIGLALLVGVRRRRDDG